MSRKHRRQKNVRDARQPPTQKTSCKVAPWPDNRRILECAGPPGEWNAEPYGRHRLHTDTVIQELSVIEYPVPRTLDHSEDH